MSNMEIKIQNHITLYQTEFFKDIFPSDNEYFENVFYTPKIDDRESSLYEMRMQMFRDNEFKAAVFIGGMEGVEIEYNMFKSTHPNAKLFPVASTGAAAKFIYEGMDVKPDGRLVFDYAYMALFRSLFEGIIN